MKKIFSTLTFSAFMVLATSGTLFASSYNNIDTQSTVVNADTRITSGYIECNSSGKDCHGYWIRGKKTDTNPDQVYSSYKDYKGQGYASVVDGNGNTSNGGWKDTNVYSTAHLKWTTAGTNKAFYNYR